MNKLHWSQLQGTLQFARDQATGREKRGQAAFSLPTMQRTGKGFDHYISDVIRAVLLRAQDLKLPLVLSGNPHPLWGPQVVPGRMGDECNKGEEELNEICAFSISEFFPKADSGEDG